MSKYTITVNESEKEAIVEAVNALYASTKDHIISYRSDDKMEDWINSNKCELENLKRFTLLKTRIGFSYDWKKVEEEDSAE
jgi:hypothetical protein